MPEGTKVLLQRALEAPAVEQLLALAAEWLERSAPAAGSADRSAGAALSVAVADTTTALVQLLAVLAALPSTYQRVRAALSGSADGDKGKAAGGKGASGGVTVPHKKRGAGSSAGSSAAAASSVDSDSGISYDPCSLEAERLARAFERVLGRDGALALTLQLQHLAGALRDNTAGPLAGADLDLLLQQHPDPWSPLTLPPMPPDCDTRTTLRLCANPLCTNLDGASELDLPRKCCSGCDVARYCSRACQVGEGGKNALAAITSVLMQCLRSLMWMSEQLQRAAWCATGRHRTACRSRRGAGATRRSARRWRRHRRRRHRRQRRQRQQRCVAASR